MPSRGGWCWFASRSKPKPAIAPKPQQLSTQAGRGNLCMMCTTEPIAITFRPCGHQVACSQCSPRMKQCFTCHQRILEKVRMDIRTAVATPCQIIRADFHFTGWFCLQCFYTVSWTTGRSSRPVKQTLRVLVWWPWWSDWSFAHFRFPVGSTAISIISWTLAAATCRMVWH